jgi:hypothetical protein
MKVLSVRQPWAWAIIHGGKDVENRVWETKHRGPLAIHAGKKFDFTREDWNNALSGAYGETYWKMAGGFNQSRPFPGDHPKGAIIGIVDIVDCIPDSACDNPWKAEGDNFWCWIVENPRPVEPLPMKGQLGLWTIPDDLLVEVKP